MIIDKYEVIEMIGEGGVGFVIAARHVELGYKVALKFLKPEMLDRPEVVHRFRCEASAAARLKNEHVVRVFDIGQLEDGLPFIVMEFLEGKDLYEVLVTEGAQPLSKAVDFVLQVCEALADAHASGIIHRDIKPENIFLFERSPGLHTVKVLDFGISKVALTGTAESTAVPLYKTLVPLGSPMYMSPEQIRASATLDTRTDVWSLGCVLYELLTGIPAFQAQSLTQLTAAILESEVSPPSSRQPRLPPAADALVARCLAKEPSQRFQNVAELALALQPYAAEGSHVSVERCCLMLGVKPLHAGGLAYGPLLGLPRNIRRAVSSIPPRSWNRGRNLALVAIILALVAVFCVRQFSDSSATAALADKQSKSVDREAQLATLLPPPSPAATLGQAALPGLDAPVVHSVAPLTRKPVRKLSAKPPAQKLRVNADPDPGF